MDEQDELQIKIDEANYQKDTYLLPENIRKDITVLGVTGTYDAGTKTDDADALPEDIRLGKTAYVKDQKITGTLIPVDTSDATASSLDILAPKTAYVDGIKVTGEIECAYVINDTATTDSISALSKSNSYGFGISDDGEYIADLRTINSSTQLAIYKRNRTSVELVVSTTSGISSTSNPDIRFSTIKENNTYRIYLGAGQYISAYNFNCVTNVLTFEKQATLTSYSSNNIYLISPANTNKDVVVAVHTNLNDWGYGPVATCIRFTETGFTTLWNAEIARWQAGHCAFWNHDDTAYCFNCEHESGNSAGYITIGDDFSYISTNWLTPRCCYIDVKKGHRILDNTLQTYKGTSWSTIGTLVSPLSDPAFVVFNPTNDLVFIGCSWSVNDIVRVYQVNWESGYNKLLYTLSVPTDHMYFGSNNGSQVIGMIGFNKDRTIVYNRKTVPIICTIGVSDELKQVIIQGTNLINLNQEITDVAMPANVLIGKEYYDGGGLSSGTMPNNGILSYTPSASTSYSIPAGYTSGGTIAKVTSSVDQDIQSANIVYGKEILGVVGDADVTNYLMPRTYESAITSTEAKTTDSISIKSQIGCYVYIFVYHRTNIISYTEGFSLYENITANTETQLSIFYKKAVSETETFSASTQSSVRFGMIGISGNNNFELFKEIYLVKDANASFEFIQKGDIIVCVSTYSASGNTGLVHTPSFECNAYNSWDSLGQRFRVLVSKQTLNQATITSNTDSTGSIIMLFRNTFEDGTNLLSENIKKGISIFGVEGSLDVTTEEEYNQALSLTNDILGR